MPRHILIVDDSGSMRQLLALTIQQLGDVEIDEACDGLDALKRLATGRYDLIFVDINIPVLDGLKLVRRIRSAPEHRGTRICVCTTESDARAQALQVGADYFLAKPVRRREVEAVLQQAFTP